MKKSVINIIFIFMPLMLVYMLVLKGQSLDEFIRQFSRVNPQWLLLSVLLIVLYWVFESITFHLIARFHKIRVKFRDSFLVTMVGQFFNSITPFASGGQPVQVMRLVKKGIDIGDASSIVMMKFVVYQSVFTVYSLVVIIFSFSNFNTKIPLLLPMTILGLSVHASMILFSFLFSYHKALIEGTINLLLKVLEKVKIIKIKENSESKLEESLANFHDNAALLKKNPSLLLKCSILMFFQITFFFSIPYGIYRGLGLTDTSFFWIFAASVFVSTVISIVPFPGALVGAEGGFYLFFGLFFYKSMIIPAILLWRMITFYSAITMGGFFVVASNYSEKHEKAKRR